ncbi:hypothetical protein BAE44_0006213 [Dichanthelium oligosanthes]|uniref:Pectinesterase inhibitor domain-containing protein n=1 Tax=Dichanthelium oligosanthes TaxID=888268 RepID=A0A1E5W5Y0_9POAL|nr:hypothetical protein BAE44_0006213 [Dichanthelium oligosanthes]
MDRFIVASLILLLAFAAAVEGRMVQAVFDDDKPRDRSGARELIGEDQCQKTCDQVHYRTMCRSLTKLPEVTTPRQLLLASMRVASDKAKEAKARVDEYAARSHEGRPMSSILDSCRQGYDSVVASLEETRKLIDAPPAHFDLNNQLSSALTSAGDCDNAFQDFPEMNSPFAAVQKNVFRLVDNVLNIAVVVQQAEGHHHASAHGPHAH